MAQKTFSHITIVEEDDDGDVAVLAGAGSEQAQAKQDFPVRQEVRRPDAAAAAQGDDEPVFEKTALDGDAEPLRTPSPAAQTGVQGHADASQPAEASQPAAAKPAAARQAAEAREGGYRQTTLDDLDAQPMPLMQKAIIVAAVVFLLAAAVYYFCFMA